MSIVAAAMPKGSARMSSSVAVMIEPALEPAFFRAMDRSEQQNPPRLMIEAGVGSAEVDFDDKTWDPARRHTAKPAYLQALEANACQGNQGLMGRIFNRDHRDKPNHRHATIEDLREFIKAKGRLWSGGGGLCRFGFWIGSHGS
jgi:hypothetical protein